MSVLRKVFAETIAITLRIAEIAVSHRCACPQSGPNGSDSPTIKLSPPDSKSRVL